MKNKIKNDYNNIKINKILNVNEFFLNGDSYL